MCEVPAELNASAARPQSTRQGRQPGEMIEFEVMIRPIKALAALGEEMGNRIGPELIGLKEVP